MRDGHQDVRDTQIQQHVARWRGFRCGIGQTVPSADANQPAQDDKAAADQRERRGDPDQHLRGQDEVGIVGEAVAVGRGVVAV